MITISTTYEDKWFFKDNSNYIITKCKKVINIKRMKVVKSTIKGGVVGWWIGGKFVPKSSINQYVVLIEKQNIPF